MIKIKTILFLDNTYPQAYQVSTLETQAIGGTESSIIKTAQILSQSFYVLVAQKYRNETHKETQQLSFISKDSITQYQPDYIIVLRKYPLLKKLQKAFPQAKLFLWIHTYKNYEYAFKRMGLAQTKTTVICNSKTHQEDTSKLLNKTLLGKLFSLISKQTIVTFCYNPIEKPSHQKILANVNRDLNKLLFFSSPNKGLTQIIKCFNAINKTLPELKLYIANPGYKKDSNTSTNTRIEILGSLPHKKMMEHLSQSLCVFYPQDSFAETFGLIYAEANAYGTAVLGHDIGSAREILHVNNKLVDANNYDQITKTIMSWQKNYPNVSYNNNFSDETILSQWKELFLN